MSADREQMHHDRGSAESFGGAAAAYERFRPSYPPALAADLLAGDPHRILDIGTGTGKAARLLTGPGRSVLGVEPDARMAAVARSFGLDVEVSAFEAWEAGGRSFDLVTCAQAWHWIEPATGARKVASLLAPGGRFTCFWNQAQPHPLHEAIAAVQREVVPEGDFGVVDLGSLEQDPYVAPLEQSGCFSRVHSKRYAWTETVSLAAWTGRLATRSDYLRLLPERRAELLSAIEERVALEEPVALPLATYAVFAEGHRDPHPEPGLA